VLYTELADYILNCLNYSANENNLEVHLVRWPVNNEAPFDFDLSQLNVYNRNDYSSNELKMLVDEIAPSLIVCSGWIDKDYVKICRPYRRKIPVVVAFDNKWVGGVKQKLAALFGRFLVTNNFNYAWVPGGRQREFAHRLGFPEERIYEGFYSANADVFRKYEKENRTLKFTNYPKRMLYLGRYVEHKGIFEMWNNFISLVNQPRFSDWELWCVGTGDQFENKIEHESIKHFGFVQPNELEDIVKGTAIYILPSKYEPWGVSTHEFAAAGYPMVVSIEVGSSEAFCSSNNAVVFDHKKKDDLKNAMAKMMSLTQAEFEKYSKKSIDLAESISPSKWSETLMKILNETN